MTIDGRRHIDGEVKSGVVIDRLIWRALLKEYYNHSIKLARQICSRLEANIDDENRGVDSKHGFRVVKWTRCPAVLVEVGFMTHRMTAAKLKTEAYRRKIAHGIAEGILEFKKEYDATRGFTKPEAHTEAHKDDK